MEINEEDFYCDEVLSGRTAVHKLSETEYSLAFYHTRPYYEQHIIVIPKKHIQSFLTVTEKEAEILADVLKVVKEAAASLNEEFGACTISTNIGDYQSNKHMHWHVHFGKRIRDENGRVIHDHDSK